MVRGEHHLGTFMASPEGVGPEPLGHPPQGQLACAPTRPRSAHWAMDRGGAVIAFWHGEQLPLVPLHANSRIAGLASSERGWSATGGCDRPPWLLRRSRQ